MKIKFIIRLWITKQFEGFLFVCNPAVNKTLLCLWLDYSYRLNDIWNLRNFLKFSVSDWWLHFKICLSFEVSVGFILLKPNKVLKLLIFTQESNQDCFPTLKATLFMSPKSSALSRKTFTFILKLENEEFCFLAFSKFCKIKCFIAVLK